MKASTKRLVELSAGDAPQLDHRLVRADRVAIGVAGGHHVVGVGDGDDPGQLGDLVAGEAARIALAVDALVVGEDDLADRLVAVDLRDDPRALGGVGLDRLPLLVGEPAAAGLEDVVREHELADVVQQAGRVGQLLVLRRRSRPGRRSRARSGRRRRCGARSSGRAGRACAAARRAARPGSRRAAGRAARAPRRAPGRPAGRATRYWKTEDHGAEHRHRADPELDVGAGDRDREQRRGELRREDRDEGAPGPWR